MVYSFNYERGLDGPDAKSVEVQVMDPVFRSAAVVGVDGRVGMSSSELAAYATRVYEAAGIGINAYGPGSTGNMPECGNPGRDRMYFESKGVGAVVIRSVYE